MSGWIPVAVALAAVAASACALGPARQRVRMPRASVEDQLRAIAPDPRAGVTLRRVRLLCALGRHDQALAELDDAIERAREQVDWDALSSLWRARGGVHLEQGNPDQALRVFGKRLELSASLHTGAVRASALVDAAYAFLLLGRVGQADHAVEQARVVGSQALDRDPLASERLGLIARALGDRAAAARHLRAAATGYRRRGDRAGALRAQVFIARMTAGAHARLEALAADHADVLDPGPRAWLRLVHAEQALAARSFGSCLAWAGQAVELADQRGLHAVAKQSRILAARCAERAGDVDAAIAHAEQAAALIERQLGRTAGALARQELGFEAFLLYRLLVDLEVRGKRPDRVARAFALTERARARSHLDAIVQGEVARFSATLPVSPALARDRAEAQARVRRLTDALVNSRRERRDLAARHRDALWALQEIDAAIKRDNPLLSRVASPEPATLARVRAHLLDDRTALLSYFVTGDRVLVFAVDRASESLAVLPRSARDIDDRVRRYRDQYLLDPDSDPDELRTRGASLYRTLIEPVAGTLRGKRRVIIVPHGALSLLPFESLVEPASGRFLIQAGDVQYSVSATLAVALSRGRDRRVRRRGFVGVGDPVYDWEAFRRGEPERGELEAMTASRGFDLWRRAVDERESGVERLGLTRLPGTARELQDIARLFGAHARIYLRGDATEDLVKTGALSGYRIIHIASHGLLTPHYQALALSLNPASAEDGFLMSSEIAGLSLDADLVVLSACRSGDTRSRLAEPVAGMALGLRSAGARSVLLSLWNVDDEATAELMVKFYRPLVKSTHTYARSLARAKRAMIAGQDDQSHPYYWAPFILHGP